MQQGTFVACSIALGDVRGHEDDGDFSPAPKYAVNIQADGVDQIVTRFTSDIGGVGCVLVRAGRRIMSLGVADVLGDGVLVGAPSGLLSGVD